MRIKATIVAYAFLVKYFKNTTITAYVGLRVKADFKGQLIDEYKLICHLCQHPIAVKGGNTSNLFSHLKNYHQRSTAS